MAGPFQPVSAGTFVPGGPQTAAVEFLPNETSEQDPMWIARQRTLLLGDETDPEHSPLPARALSWNSQFSDKLASPVSASGLGADAISSLPTEIYQQPAAAPEAVEEQPAVRTAQQGTSPPKETEGKEKRPAEPEQPAAPPQATPKAPPRPEPQHQKRAECPAPKAAPKAEPQQKENMYTDGTYWQSHGTNIYRFLLRRFSSKNGMPNLL